MPRVHLVRKSRKECTDSLTGLPIPKGSAYYWWKPYRAGKRRSLRRPRPSELTQSSHNSAILAAMETSQDALGALEIAVEADQDMDAWLEELTDAWETFKSAIEEAATEWEGVADELRTNADSIREHFGDTEQVEDMDNRAENLEDAASQLQAIVADAQGTEPQNWEINPDFPDLPQLVQDLVRNLEDAEGVLDA